MKDIMYKDLPLT